MFSWLFKGSYKKRPKAKISKGHIKPFTMKAIEADWRNIKVLLEGKKPSQLRQALISADKSLDNALKDLVTGQTMGERLKNAPHLFESNLYNKIWRAHKTRNALVHESGYEPPHHILTSQIETFRKALNTLGVKNI